MSDITGPAFSSYLWVGKTTQRQKGKRQSSNATRLSLSKTSTAEYINTYNAVLTSQYFSKKQCLRMPVQDRIKIRWQRISRVDILYI